MSAIHGVENGQWSAAETLSSVFHLEARLNLKQKNLN